MRIISCPNKAISAVFAVLFFIFFSYPVYAQMQGPGAGNTPFNATDAAALNEANEKLNKEEDKNQAREKVQEKKEAWQEKKLEVRARVIQRMKLHGTTMFTRYEAAVERLDNIVLRIENRVELEKEKGADTSTIEASIAGVKVQISDINNSLNDAKSVIETITPEGDENEIRSVISQVKDILKGEKQKLIDIHQSLKLIVTQLKTLANHGE